MKRLFVMLVVLLIFVMFGCDVSRTDSDAKGEELIPDCVVSNSSNADYSLTIIANCDEIENKETFAKQLIEQVRNNEFKRIMFSFEETGYPTGLHMSVYLTEQDWKKRDKEPYMTVSFRQEGAVEGYNIVEHYDKFLLDVK